MRISDWSSDVCSSDLLATGGALLSLALLFILSGKAESPLTLILAGIAVGTLAVAGTSLALNLSPNPFAAMEIMTWLLGSLENRSFDHVWIALPCIAAGAMMLLWNGRALDALTLGEDAAQALGTDLRRTRFRRIGRAHVLTPVTNAHLVCRLLLEKKKNMTHN